VPTVFTTGYQHHGDPAALIETLGAAGIARVVDVRELPLSRKPGFSKSALAAALGAAGIAYEHVRALGNPKEYRALYRAGRADEGRQRYAEYLERDAAQELAELAGSLGGAPTCLLCLETDPADCHRSVIVEALESRIPALDVVHLS
jgi:uncharacterized protein (DUF488 family)